MKLSDLFCCFRSHRTREDTYEKINCSPEETVAIKKSNSRIKPYTMTADQQATLDAVEKTKDLVVETGCKIDFMASIKSTEDVFINRQKSTPTPFGNHYEMYTPDSMTAPILEVDEDSGIVLKTPSDEGQASRLRLSSRSEPAPRDVNPPIDASFPCGI